MDVSSPRLLDCGHVGVLAGVCQHHRCATLLCPDCIATCEACGTVLCRSHQVWMDAGRRVFCPDDMRGYLGFRIGLYLLRRRDSA